MDGPTEHKPGQQQNEPGRDEAERNRRPKRAAVHRKEPSRSSDLTEVKRLAAVSLDCHGTLIHTPRMPFIYAEVLTRHGLNVTGEQVQAGFHEVWEEFESHRQLGHERYGRGPEDARRWWFGFLSRLCERLDIGEPTPFTAAELFDRFAHADAWEVFPEVAEALLKLKERGFQLAVVSNWDHRLPALLDRLGLGRFFEVVVYSQDVGAEKPEPLIFERALARLGLSPGAVLHVGDRAMEDVEGALGVGMRALLLDRESGEGDVHSLADIVTFVDE